MANYKAWKIPGIGEKPIWVIVDETGRTVNNNPTKEELKDLDFEIRPHGNTRIEPYNETDTCDRCQIGKLSPEKAFREYDRCGGETGKWLCKSCWDKDPGSDNTRNLVKSMAKCRLIGFDKNHGSYRTILSETVVAKVHKCEYINIENDDFNCCIDLRDKNLGDIDVKAVSPDDRDYFGFRTRRKCDCDTYICIGMDNTWNNIEAVYIIPNEDKIIDISMIKIARHPKHGSTYGCYKVDPKPYNDIYHDLVAYIGDKESFTIEDIKKWLNA
jgi:hypothetical protein